MFLRFTIRFLVTRMSSRKSDHTCFIFVGLQWHVWTSTVPSHDTSILPIARRKRVSPRVPSRHGRGMCAFLRGHHARRRARTTRHVRQGDKSSWEIPLGGGETQTQMQVSGDGRVGQIHRTTTRGKVGTRRGSEKRLNICKLGALSDSVCFPDDVAGRYTENYATAADWSTPRNPTAFVSLHPES